MPATATPLRQSALKAASCLKRFHEVYDLGLDDTSDESRRGTAFHVIVLEHYIPALVQASRAADAALLDRAFRRGIVAAQCPPHLVDEVEWLVFSFGQRFELDLAAYLLSEERQVTRAGHTWKPDLTFAWRSTPRGSVLRIEDLKTFHAILSEDAVRSEFQPKFYLRNAMETWPGFDVYEFAMTFVRFPGATTVVEFTPDDFDRLDRKVEAIVATIEDARARDAWPAQPGDHCAFCQLACDAADDPRVLDRRILSAEEATIVGGRLAVTKRLADADRNALKAWCVTHGQVVVNGLEYANRARTTSRYDARKVLKTIDDHRAPDPPGLSFGSTALDRFTTKKAQRAWPGLLEDLQALAIPSTSTTFSAKKVGDMAPDTDGAPAQE